MIEADKKKAEEAGNAVKPERDSKVSWFYLYLKKRYTVQPVY